MALDAVCKHFAFTDEVHSMIMSIKMFAVFLHLFFSIFVGFL